MATPTSKEIADGLMLKFQEAQKSTDQYAAETMCRCVDSLIKLARLEMDYAQMRQEKPSVPYLRSGECHPDSLEGKVDKVKNALKGTW